MADAVLADKKKISHAAANTDQLIPLGILAGLLCVLIYSYGNTLLEATRFWDNPKYSHGWVVPLFTLALLWIRYQPIGAVPVRERWYGVALLCAGLGLRMFFTYIPMMVPEMQTFVISVAGLVMMVGGWKMLRWAGPAVLFLVFMFPLPGPLDSGLLMPLQRLATNASTYVLQTLGLPAYSEGNNIFFDEVKMGVVEQCSGLRMLTIFVAFAVGITLITDRPIWERIVIVLSAVPIALVVNIIRITVTGVLHRYVGGEIADRVFHDLAGWVMMPMALGFLYVVFQILSHLVIDDGPTGPVPIGAGLGMRR